MEGLLGLLALVVLAVPVLLVVALVSINGLKRRVGELEVEIDTLKSAAAKDVLAPRVARARPPRATRRVADGIHRGSPHTAAA